MGIRELAIPAVALACLSHPEKFMSQHFAT
jgi:hypothetical protein